MKMIFQQKREIVVGHSGWQTRIKAQVIEGSWCINVHNDGICGCGCFHVDAIMSTWMTAADTILLQQFAQSHSLRKRDKGLLLFFLWLLCAQFDSHSKNEFACCMLRVVMSFIFS